MNIKKATGIDNIPPKVIKLGKPALLTPITNLVNLSIRTSVFPDKAKVAQVIPVYKKGDPLDKKNYRPVSILTSMSKFFEKTIALQLESFFDDIFNPFLCAFRRGHGCQTTLLRLVEDWKKALDSDQLVAAILMDLSKAFDCLPHDILLDKNCNLRSSK